MIPSLAHFVWLGGELPWVYALAAASAGLRGGFDRVLFHHTDRLERQPAWADLVRSPRVEPRLMDPLAVVEQAGGPLLVDCYRQLNEPVARANVLRVALLAEQGGVYLDADTVTVRRLDALRAEGGFFCGKERLVFPRTSHYPWVSRLDPRALARTAVRDLCRRLPRGYMHFHRIERLYKTAANNAILGAEVRHPFAEDLLARMRALPPEQRRVRYALGAHLLQAAVAEWSGNDLSLLPPEIFFPLGPEISEHWFRLRNRVALDEVVVPSTLVVHWYASVRVRHRLASIDTAWVRAHAEKQMFSALALPILEEMGW